MLITVDEAREIILGCIKTLEAEEKPVLQVLGQVSAEDLYAPINMPGFDSSARDGFAVISSDISSAGPTTPRVLRVIETTAAGFVPKKRVIPGTAIRIMTGAPIPEGSDAVVSFEDTDNDARQKGEGNGWIGILRYEKKGANIRQAGDQIRKGERVIGKGAEIGPVEVGIAASLGLRRLKVIRRPVVAVFTTGEELVQAGKPLKPAMIYSGNSVSIAAQLQKYGCIPRILGIARDNKAALIRMIYRAAGADMIISTGGVAAGDRDLVVDTLASLGKVLFWGLRMTPGKSSALVRLKLQDSSGKEREIPHFALSGSPAASLVGMEVLVRPAVRQMMGKDGSKEDYIEAIIEDNLNNTGKNRRFAWVRVEKREGKYYARLSDEGAKGILASIAASGGLAVIPENMREVRKGSKLKILLLDWH